MTVSTRACAASLNRSFEKAYRLFECPIVARRAVILLLAIQSGLLAYSAYIHSPTLNEPGHLVAGLTCWKFSRFDVYNVNPPLVKMVAALPVLAVGHKEDWSGFSTRLGARPEFRMGADFQTANGDKPFILFMIARWACLPFSWLGGVICYLWARDLYDRPAGVIACAIWCFEPNILAHASLITPDAHASALGLAACYAFWRWLKQPTWMQTILTGVVLGLAELAKTTLIVFYPLWPLIWLMYRWPQRSRMRLSEWIREGSMLAARMAIGIYVLNLGYGFEGTLTQLGEYRFNSRLLAGEFKAEQSPDRHYSVVTPMSPPQNRFAGSWLGNVPVPFPKNYIGGIDLQLHDFDSRDQPSYLRGEWRNQGWWYYYLYAAAIKIPIGLLILSALVPFFWRPSVKVQDIGVLLSPAIVVFVIVSLKTGFNAHMRYVLPCFPFMFVLIGGFSGVLLDNGMGKLVSSQNNFRRIANLLAPSIFSSSVIWSIASSLWIYPHSLSYFNESIGGPRQGARHLLGSNLDWGQDLRYVQSFFAQMDEDAAVGVACQAYPKTPLKKCNGPLLLEITNVSTVIDVYVVSVAILAKSPFSAWNTASTGSYRIDPAAVEGISRLSLNAEIGYTHKVFE